MKCWKESLQNVRIGTEVNEAVSSSDVNKVIKHMHGRDFGWNDKNRGKGYEAQGPDRSGGITIIDWSGNRSSDLRELVKNFDGPDSLYSQYFASEMGVGFKVQRSEVKKDNVFVVLKPIEQSVNESFKLVLRNEDIETTYLADDLSQVFETLSNETYQSWALTNLETGLMKESDELIQSHEDLRVITEGIV